MFQLRNCHCRYKHPATAALRLVAYAAKHHPAIARERLVFSGPVSPKVKHVQVMCATRTRARARARMCTHTSTSSHTISPSLQRLKLADLYLDTLTYNGHTTGSDVLWAGDV